MPRTTDTTKPNRAKPVNARGKRSNKSSSFSSMPDLASSRVVELDASSGFKASSEIGGRFRCAPAVRADMSLVDSIVCIAAGVEKAATMEGSATRVVAAEQVMQPILCVSSTGKADVRRKETRTTRRESRKLVSSRLCGSLRRSERVPLVPEFRQSLTGF